MMPALPASGMPVTEPSKIAPSAVGPRGLKLPSEGSGEIPYGVEPKNVQTFFAVYFTMTGLHGIHVLAGIVVLIGLLVLSLKGTYGPAYFTPVELTGLYWHLVDLIWIFLFPLFYLIG